MKHRSGRRPCLPVPCSLQPSRLLGSPSCHPVPLSQSSRERHRQNLGVHSTQPSYPLREVWGGHRRQLSHLSQGFIIHTQCSESAVLCLLWNLTEQSSHICSVIGNTGGQPLGERSPSLPVTFPLVCEVERSPLHSSCPQQLLWVIRFCPSPLQTQMNTTLTLEAENTTTGPLPTSWGFLNAQPAL